MDPQAAALLGRAVQVAQAYQTSGHNAALWSASQAVAVQMSDFMQNNVGRLDDDTIDLMGQAVDRMTGIAQNSLSDAQASEFAAAVGGFKSGLRDSLSVGNSELKQYLTLGIIALAVLVLFNVTK